MPESDTERPKVKLLGFVLQRIGQHCDNNAALLQWEQCDELQGMLNIA
jgi:hypothetical protein